MAIGKLTGFTVDDYLQALRRLLPPGPAWDGYEAEPFSTQLWLIARELQRIDLDIAQLIEESDPRTASVTLSQWFREWGIPDECLLSITGATAEQYRQVLIAKITSMGLTFSELVALVASACGLDGVSVERADPHTVSSPVNHRLYSPEWVYAALIVISDSSDAARLRDVTWDVSRALAEWGNALFECIIRSLAPAYVSVIFQYDYAD